MLEQLIGYDKWLLLQLNGNGNFFWDQFMWIYTGKLVWIPLVLSLMYVYCRKYVLEALLIITVSVIVVTLCDQISSSFFKPYFARFRPTQDPDMSGLVNMVQGYKGGRYGFISSHAANAAGMVTFTALVFRNRIYTISMILWALINCYTRIYLGVHYPGDIIAGLTLGVIIGLTLYKAYTILRTFLYGKGWLRELKNPYIQANKKPVLITLYLTWAFIIIYSAIV